MTADWPSVGSALRLGGFEVTKAEPVVPSLEDIFIDRIAEAGTS
jgi:hypothetical protein